MKQLSERLVALNLKRFLPPWWKKALWWVVPGVFLIYLQTTATFTAISSSSMEPAFSRGDLIICERVRPETIRPGDVVVLKVDPLLQGQYHYPATICHRVSQIKHQNNGLYFNTRGDTTGEDPFINWSGSLVGKEKKAIPILGYALLFVRSGWGLTLLMAVALALTGYFKRGAIASRVNRLRSSFSGVTPTEFKASQTNIETRMVDMTERVVKSMNGFSSAMSEYAHHIASHTGAVKSLAEAAQHMESVLVKQDAALNSRLKDDAFQNERNSPSEITTGRRETVHPPLNSEPSENLPENGIKVVQIAVKEDTLELPADYPDTLHPAPAAQNAIEVTPELKMAVKEFIFKYNIDHGLEKVEMTPELRYAIWNFILEYNKKPLLPPPGAYLSAIKTVKIVAESDGFDPDELENDGKDLPRVRPI
jgi:signal peptidase I